MIVMKFGGTSVADAERIQAVARIVEQHLERRPVVVVSALGGVTDLLEQAVTLARNGDLEGLDPILADLVRRHRWALAGTVETDSGPRTLIGYADLVLETPDGLVLVDHKCYPPEDEALLRQNAEGYAPQLLSYATLLEMATGRKVLATLIHFPLAGRMIEVEVEREAARALV